MRLLVLIIASLELLLLVAGVLNFWLSDTKTDLAGQGLAQAYVVVGTLVAALLLLPALTLALYDRLLWLALVLAVVASIFVLTVLVAG